MVAQGESRAVLVLGMHRSGTSCLAGMLSAAGVASAGASVRNWDNARGHFESLEVVRLNEAVLAGSDAHWLRAPSALRWTEQQAAERERLLERSVDGRPALIKDPRSLLCLPFWRASTRPLHVIGIVRHPLSVARSLAAWRGIPLDAGVALWTAHNRALLADHEAHGDPLLDFELPRAEFLAAATRACRVLGLEVDERALASAHDERLVHHDSRASGGDGRTPRRALPGLEEAEALHVRLLARAGSRCGSPGDSPAGPEPPPRYPGDEMARFERELLAGNRQAAAAAARAALERCPDAAAVAVPVVAACLRRDPQGARSFLELAAPRLEAGLAQLLLGKVLLAGGDARGALGCLEAACAQPEPYYQARRLLPHALRLAGRRAEARRALAALAPDTLYPQGPLSLLAEWAWSDHDPRAAQEHMLAALQAAPVHRRGKLRTRLARWLEERGQLEQARSQLERALEEDPRFEPARGQLERLAALAAGPPA